jgi:tRNA pseudouridine55 synthase
LKPRTVEVDELAVLDWAPAGPEQKVPLLTLEVACSPGTYIRSLAHDLGRSLGSGAYLSSLVRLKSGRFSFEDAVSLSRLEEAFLEGDAARYVLPVDEALLDWPALIVGQEDARRITQGLPVEGEPPPAEREGALKRTLRAHCRAYSLEGDFLAILAYRPEVGQWWPNKVFAGLDSSLPSASAATGG